MTKLENLIAEVEQMTGKAYPNYQSMFNIPGQHNLEKWLQAVKQIYYQQKQGSSYQEAVKQTTSGWPVMETSDFLNWLKYYQEGNHLKYKTAQMWYENGQPGYFLSIKPDSKSQNQEVQSIEDAKQEVDHSEQKKEIIERQRSKIISRLDAAEKLLRSNDGNIFAGNELEQLIDAIYNLKKRIHLVNKVSASTRIYQDMAVREANILQKNGYVGAANWLSKIADQLPQMPPNNITNNPANGGEVSNNVGDLGVISPGDPATNNGYTGAPSGGAPSMAPGMPQPPGNPPTAPSENQIIPSNIPTDTATKAIAPVSVSPNGLTEPPKDKPKVDFSPGMKQFLEDMDTQNEDDDILEINDADENNLEVSAGSFDLFDYLMAIGQAAGDEEIPLTTAPVPPPRKPVPKFTPKEDEEKEPTSDALKPESDVKRDVALEVSENEPANEMGVVDPEKSAVDVDALINNSLGDNVSIEDILAKLNDINKIFKTREIPRQLYIVDILLQQKGLVSLFPSLGEIIQKNLENLNYSSSRLENIISQLHGAIEGTNIDLKGNQSPQSEVGMRLQEQAEKEKKRKQMRKEQENADLLNKSTKEVPTVDIGNDLAAPTQVAPAANPTPQR